MSDIFQEIDEDLRQDKAARLWKAYGKYLIALAIFIILAIASYRFMNTQMKKKENKLLNCTNWLQKLVERLTNKLQSSFLAMNGSKKPWDIQLYQS